MFPLDLITFYPLPKDLNWLALPYSLSILATVTVSAGLFLMRRRWPGLLAAWLSYLVILAPNSGIIRNNSAVIAADRYSYTATLGSVILAAAVFCRLWRMAWRWHPQAAIGMIAIGLGVLLGLTALTRDQCRTWLDSEALWTHALTHAGNSGFVAHNNLGEALRAKGSYQAAEAHFVEALRLRPDYIAALNNLGIILQTKRSYQAAEAHFTEALRLNPRYFNAHYNLGNLLSGQGRYAEAEAHYTEALRLNPGYVNAHYNLGNLHSGQGRYAEAEAHYTEALRLSPGYADAHMSLGLVHFRQRRYAEAEAHFAEAVRLNPGSVAAHFNLGFVHAEQGKYEEAQAHYAEAIRLQPGYVGAHYNLGVVLSRLGNCEAAKDHYALAIRLDPGFAEAYNASAFIMATHPDAKFRDGKGAVAFATRACELTKWKDPRFLDTLAAAKAEAGDFDAAVSSQKRAIELLTNERQKANYRSRLALYQGKKPYRELPSRHALTKASP